MKAVFGRNKNVFMRRVLNLSEQIEPGLFEGTLYFGRPQQCLFVFNRKIAPLYSEIIDADDVSGRISMAAAGNFDYFEKLHIGSMEEIIANTFIEGVNPQDFWYEDVIIAFSTQEHLAEIVELLLMKGNCQINFCMVKGDDFNYLIRVKDISIYTALYCTGEKRGRIFYRLRSDTGMSNCYVPWGREYPAFNTGYILPAIKKSGLVILAEDGCLCEVEPESFKSINSFITPEFKGLKREIKPEPRGRVSINITVRLKKADDVLQNMLPPEELWFIPATLFELFAADLYCPESALKGLEGAAFSTESGQTMIAVWNGGSGQNLRGVSLASLVHPGVQAFYSVQGFELQLFLPKGHILYPALEPSTVKNLFDIHKGIFTVVFDENGRTSVAEISLSDFKPIRKALVDYVFVQERKKIEMLLDNPLYDFGKPVLYPKPKPEIIVKYVDKSEEDMISRKHDVQEKTSGERSLPMQLNDTKNEEKDVSDKESLEDMSDEAEGEAETSKKDRKVKSYEELLIDKANEYIQRYQELTCDDWSKYMASASVIPRLKSDSYSALLNMLFQNPEGSMTDRICQGLGLGEEEQEKLWSGSLDEVLGRIFSGDKGVEKPETVLFKICAAAARFNSENDCIVRDNENRKSVYGLRRMMNRTGNPKYIWLSGRICSRICRDSLALSQSRILIQNIFMDSHSDLGIPKTIRQELGKKYLRQYSGEITCAIDAFKPCREYSAWFSLLTGFFMEKSGFFVLDLEKCSEAAGIPDGDWSDDAKRQIESFLSYLRKLVFCSYEHPGECSFESHLEKEQEVFISFVSEIMNGHRGYCTIADESEEINICEEDTAVLERIRKLEPPCKDQWRDFSRIAGDMIKLKGNARFDALEAYSKKLDQWRETLDYGGCMAAALDFLVEMAEKPASGRYVPILAKAAAAGDSIQNKRRLFALVIDIMNRESSIGTEDSFEEISNAVTAAQVLERTNGGPLELDELLLVYRLVEVVFSMFDRMPGDFHRVMEYERAMIRRTITSEGIGK